MAEEEPQHITEKKRQQQSAAEEPAQDAKVVILPLHVLCPTRLNPD
jgi:hypothetical protein